VHPERDTPEAVTADSNKKKEQAITTQKHNIDNANARAGMPAATTQ
jgi:hypothetical protein